MKSILHAILLIFALSTIHHHVHAQKDSVRFSNGDLIVGEIKTMDKGVLTMKTDYSDKDFLIEWKEVAWVKTQSHFLIMLKEGYQYYSTLVSENDSIVKAINNENKFTTFKIQSIVYLNSYDDGFKDRFSAAIDIGIDLAKTNQMRKLTSSFQMGYKTNKWSSDILFNTLQSVQDDTDPIQRSDGSANFRYVLPKNWYCITTLSILSNTEQKIDMRYNMQQGFGHFFTRTNSAFWGGKIGVNRNMEKYSNEPEGKNSWESYLGTELNLYDVGDLSLSVGVISYFGLTEKGRFRTDANINFKYDLPLDFYVKIGTSMNFDNQPSEGSSKYDYVFQTGFGWEW
ncbi:DUF481 domain-containing protein [Labilibacter marinus]|uniref:DUF481 domain-containing protein n=1 Tax=Labilibacter marinus TaxID=1477105 RepID=UPI00094FCE66|nr:DUF481 domain-containing protein [Labilibacter marinus]